MIISQREKRAVLATLKLLDAFRRFYVFEFLSFIDFKD
jgi:hypothetical protein